MTGTEPSTCFVRESDSVLSKCLTVLRTGLSWLDDLSMGVMIFTWSFIEARKVTNVVSLKKSFMDGSYRKPNFH